MELLAKKSHKISTQFGPPYAVLNLTKIGLRYFRILIKCSPTSRDRLVKHFIDHPNIGWIFSAEGWCNLAVGIWAKDNAEINNIGTAIRTVLGKGDEIVYQSELTSLYGFGNRPTGAPYTPMPIVDSVYSSIELSPLELDYIKLLTLDSSLSKQELSEIMGTSIEDLEKLDIHLTRSGVIVGYQERIQYAGVYYKVFVDTLSAKNSDSLDQLTTKLWKDDKCIYIERANGKYDFEFELILRPSSQLKEYIKDFSDYKVVILTQNLYTNLYPLSKTANLREIKETLVNQEGPIFDFRNSKLWYLNHNAAEDYLNIYENKKYFEVMEKGEVDLFEGIVSYIREKNPDINFSIIDIGSGDGLKGRVFIEKLGEDTVKAYYPIDIQPIELATALRSHEEGTYAKHPTLLNIENLSVRFPLKLQPNEKQIYIFLGGTYGNFQSAKINANLKPVLSHTSLLLIAMPIVAEHSSKEEIIASYTGDRFNAFFFGPLSQMGFRNENFELNPTSKQYQVHYSFEDNRLISSFVLKEDVVVLGRTYKRGSVFKMTTSWKPTLEQFQRALEADFVIERIFKNESMAVMLVKAKEN